MKKVIGITLAIIIIALGLYVGGWVMFVGGIASLIDIVKSANYDGIIIAKNIAKIIFVSVTTSIIVCIGMMIGMFALYEGNVSIRHRRRR